MTEHHLPPEQLSLNFAPAITTESAPLAEHKTHQPSATIYNLARARAITTQAETARLYAQIIESVKHIG